MASGQERSEIGQAVNYSSKIQEFSKRARQLRFLANGVLILIVILLLGGAGAFIFARQLTDTEFPKNSHEKLDEIRKQEGEIISRNSQVNAKIQNFFRDFTAIFEKYKQQPPEDKSLIIDEPLAPGEADVFYSKESWQNLIIKDIANLPKDRYLKQNNFGVLIKVSDLQAIYNDISQSTLFNSITDDDRNFIKETVMSGKLDTLQAAEKAVRADIQARDVANIIGSNSVQNDSSNKDLVQIIQTNITRFGTIIIITFLVSILTPLYRYNIRLASYYDARADALHFLSTPLKSIGFVRLSGALTPTLDFGKSPQTPVEQIIELAKIYAGSRRGDEPD